MNPTDPIRSARHERSLTLKKSPVALFGTLPAFALAQMSLPCEEDGTPFLCCEFADADEQRYCTVGSITLACGDDVTRNDATWQLVSASEGYSTHRDVWDYCEMTQKACHPVLICQVVGQITHACQGEQGLGVCGPGGGGIQ